MFNWEMGAAASSCSIGEDLLQAICSGEDEARVRKVSQQSTALSVKEPLSHRNKSVPFFGVVIVA